MLQEGIRGKMIDKRAKENLVFKSLINIGDGKVQMFKDLKDITGMERGQSGPDEIGGGVRGTNMALLCDKFTLVRDLLVESDNKSTFKKKPERPLLAQQFRIFKIKDAIELPHVSHLCCPLCWLLSFSVKRSPDLLEHRRQSEVEANAVREDPPCGCSSSRASRPSRLPSCRRSLHFLASAIVGRGGPGLLERFWRRR